MKSDVPAAVAFEYFHATLCQQVGRRDDIFLPGIAAESNQCCRTNLLDTVSLSASVGAIVKKTPIPPFAQLRLNWPRFLQERSIGSRRLAGSTLSKIKMRSMSMTLCAYCLVERLPGRRIRHRRA
jgi:hypothetical protein